MRAWLWTLVASVMLVGCDGGEVTQSPAPPPTKEPSLLVRRDLEPAGKNCPYGGTAIRSGLDRNGDGVLGDDEVQNTTYACNPATSVLVRRDPIAPSLDCPDGGVAVQTGIDDNGDNVLEDAEIDQTTRICNSLELWNGDFLASHWADPVKVAALQGARVVTGSLEISSTTPVTLPLLEQVGGDLSATSPSIALPALHQVGGKVEIWSAVIATPFTALQRVGGTLFIASSSVPGSGASFDAPNLREVRGDMVLFSTVGGKVSMPQLTTVGGNLTESGHLTELHLDALTAIGGNLVPDDSSLTPFTLPALKSIDGDLVVRFSNAASFALPALEQLRGKLTIDEAMRLTAASLPALTTIGGDLLVQVAGALTTIDLSALETVGGAFTVFNAPALTTLLVPRLRTVSGINGDVNQDSIAIGQTGLEELDFNDLTTVTGGISTVQNDALRTVLLPRLTSALSVSCREDRPAAHLDTVSAPLLFTVQALGFSGNTIHTLDFRSITQLPRGLVLTNTSLTDLSGFRSLVTAGPLLIGDSRLQDLRGLSSLQNVLDLVILSSNALTSLDGLDGLTEVSGEVFIRDNTALIRAALPNLISVGGRLGMGGSSALTSLDLSSLRTVGQDLLIGNLPSLTSLSGLAALTNVGEDLDITLRALTSLSGLAALTTVGGTLRLDVPDVPADEVTAFRQRLGQQ